MDHLSDETKQFLLSDPDFPNRKRFIQADKWISYPIAKKVIDEMDELVNHPRNIRMKSLLVVGTTNNGKTSIRKRFENLHPHRVNGEDVEFPIVSVQATHNLSDRSFINVMLKELSQPHRISGKIENSLNDLLIALRDLNCKLLLIDEIQTINGVSFKNQRMFLNLIKYISNEVNLPIVAFGTEEALNAFSADPQLDNRFRTMLLPRWEANDELRRLLASIERKIPLRESSLLSDKEMAITIFSRTNGTIGEISDLVKLAALEACAMNKEKITIDIIRKVKFQSGNDRSELKRGKL